MITYPSPDLSREDLISASCIATVTTRERKEKVS